MKTKLQRLDDFLYLKFTLEKVYLWHHEDLNDFKQLLKKFVQDNTETNYKGTYYVSHLDKYLCYNINHTNEPKLLLSIHQKNI